MGTWGSTLFADDTACDIRDDYRERIEDGADDAEATRATLARFSAYFDDPECGTVCILALAVTQSRIGRLDPGIRSRALAAIDGPGHLSSREIEKVRAQLTGPQPARKRLRPPRRPACGLAAGDALALTTPSGLALLRVVRVKPHRLGETPILEQMRFQGVELPSQQDLDRLQPLAKATIGLSGEPRFSAFVAYDRIGWEQAGFHKVASFTPRPGDDEAYASSGVAWSAIAASLRSTARF